MAYNFNGFIDKVLLMFLLQKASFSLLPPKSTQRDGGELTESAKDFLEKLAQAQTKAVQIAITKGTLTHDLVELAVRKNAEYYKISIDQKQYVIDQLEALYRQVLKKITTTLEDITPEFSDISVAQASRKDSLVVRTHIGKNDKVLYEIPFRELVDELNQLDEPIVFGDLSKDSSKDSDLAILGQIARHIVPIGTIDHRANIVLHNGNLRKDHITNSAGKKISVRMIEALERAGWSRTAIANYYDVCKTTVSNFMTIFAKSSKQNRRDAEETKMKLLATLEGRLEPFKNGTVQYQWVNLSVAEILQLATEKNINLPKNKI